MQFTFWSKYWDFTFKKRYNNGHTNLGVIYHYEKKLVSCLSLESGLTSPLSVHLGGNFPPNLKKVVIQGHSLNI